MAFIVINTYSGNTGLVTITLTTEHKPFTFIIDTGSNVSHINTEAAQTLQKLIQAPTKDNSVIGIEGSLKSVGIINQTFNSGIFTFNHDFFVTDLSSMVRAIKDDGNIVIHGILGTDFLLKYRCHLDFKKSRLHLS